MRAMKKTPLTVEHLWNLPRLGAPEPSPDGARFVLPVTRWSMESNESTTRLWLVPGASTGIREEKPGAARALTTAEASSGSPAWSPDGARVAFVRKANGKKDEKKAGPKYADKPQIYVIGADGGEAERLTDMPLGAADPMWFPDGKRIAFVAAVMATAPGLEATAKKWKEREEDPCKVHATEDRVYRYWDKWMTDGTVHHVFAIDVASKEVTDLTPDSTRVLDPDDPTGCYDISPDGREIVLSACRTKAPHDPWLFGLFTVDVARGTTREITPPGWSNVHRGSYSPDGRFILYGAQKQFDFYADRVRLCTYERRTRKHAVLTEAWDNSAGGWAFGKDPHTAYFLAEVGPRGALWSLDIRRPGTPKKLATGGHFGAPKIAGGRVFMSLTTIMSPPEAVSTDLRGKGLRRHTAFTRTVLDGVQLCRVEDVTVTGAEGDPVQMFILHPPGATAGNGKRFPLVHMIHGGPHGHFGDEWHFRWNPHAFAAPGYVVAMVNFHGSTGWGERFTASILGRWGDQPYYDVTVATDYLIANGLVNPKKMAVTGGSYGGYLVAWICSQTDRFACAVNHAGVSDLQTQYGSDVTQGRQRSMGGEPWDRIEGMDRWSPMRHARGFRTPMLVLHGEKDYRVPYGQGLEVYNVYKAMKLPARLVVYPEENHWILKPRTSRNWYGEVLGWLKRWLKK
jgi:dipeptidyl aminopeptidase/acylaminoacyl peptidase